MDILPNLHVSCGGDARREGSTPLECGGCDSPGGKHFCRGVAGNVFVAGHVGLAFAVPEGAVGFWAGGALAAVTPIASAVRRRNVKCQDVTPPSSYELLLSRNSMPQVEWLLQIAPALTS